MIGFVRKLLGCFVLSSNILIGDANADKLEQFVVSVKEQSHIRDGILRERLDSLLPKLMREQEIDCWIIVSQEYNEDPIMKTILPSDRLSARRTSIVIFLDHGPDKGVERLLAARFSEPEFYEQLWDLESEKGQWQSIHEALKIFSPKKIAINTSDIWGHADGLSHTKLGELTKHVPEDFLKNMISAEILATRWLETRTSKEIEVYKNVTNLTSKIISEGISNDIIVPGKTTKGELAWWFRQRVFDLGLDVWFFPIVDIGRSDRSKNDTELRNTNAEIIQERDILFVALGISYLGFHSDSQLNAYILGSNEKEVPAELRIALNYVAKVQDLIASNMKIGITGNKVLKISIDKAKSSEFQPIVYSHPIGLHGHGAGTLIGLWEQQEGVEGNGNYTLHANTVYAIETTVLSNIPTWSKEPLPISLGQLILFDGMTYEYLSPKQTGFEIIRSNKFYDKTSVVN